MAKGEEFEIEELGELPEPAMPVPDRVRVGVNRAGRPRKDGQPNRSHLAAPIEIEAWRVEAGGRLGLTQEEMAAMLGLSMGKFQRLLRQRVPDQTITYRDVFERGQLVVRASLRRTLIEQSKMMNTAGVTAAKWLSANWFGWSERRSEEHNHRGRVEHAHAHLVKEIPADLDGMTDAQLADMALGAVGGKGTRH